MLFQHTALVVELAWWLFHSSVEPHQIEGVLKFKAMGDDSEKLRNQVFDALGKLRALTRALDSQRQKRAGSGGNWPLDPRGQGAFSR